MSEEREGADRFELAVDRAVRDLLNVEPPAGLRSRVLQRIESEPVARETVASAFRRKTPSAWLVLPLAAAAILILAVIVPWRPHTVAPAATRTASVELPAAPAAEKPTPTVREVPASTNPTTRRVARPQVPEPRTVNAAIADTTDANVTTIEPLAGPAAIAIGRLSGPPAPAMSSIEPAPMRVEALEIPALPQAPRERREE